MKSGRIILADPEQNYILKLQIKFLQEMHNAYEIDVISNREFLENHFSSPQKADCLIIGEEWASADLAKHNIDHIVLLTEGTNEESGNGQFRTGISKYTSTDEIYIHIRNLLGIEHITGNVPPKGCEVIMFHSASGGVGKTILAISLAELLSKKYYKILYVNTQSVQSFQYYLNDRTPIPSSTAISILENKKDIYRIVRSQIREERFCYIPPFAMPLFSYGLGAEIYTEIIKMAKKSREFDYVIVDSGNDLDSLTAEHITLSDRVVMVLSPEPEDLYALREMLKKINIENEKLICLCNRERLNPINDSSVNFGAEINESISEWIKKIDSETIHEFAASEDIQKLAVLVG